MTDGTIEPMTEDELAAIEERDVEFAAGCKGDAMIIAYDRAALLNEVRRLRALMASDCADRATITVERTGGAFSIAANEFRITFPNGSTSTLWSPPWNDHMPETETAGALRHAAEKWFTLCEAWQKQAEEDAEREHARQEDAAEDRREARTLERLDGDTDRDASP